MSEISHHKPGTFCWVELATTNQDAAKKFYTSLFGWEINDHSMGEQGVYTIFQIAGKDVAAGYTLNEQQKSEGVPPHWMSYVSVASVDESVKRAKSLGGNVLMDAMDVFDLGRMAVLQDPTGAVFSLWQSLKHTGTQLTQQFNTFCWNELATTDTQAAEAFYAELFHWKPQTNEFGNTRYTSFMSGEQGVGGMLEMTPEWGEVPPHWLVYFSVENCDKTAEKARSSGADIKVPPTDISGVGRFAIIQDPQGAVFGIIKLNMPS